VSYNASGLDSTILNIRTALTTSFKKNTFGEPEESTSTRLNSPLSTDEKSAVEKQIESIDSDLEHYILQVDQLETGSWFEFSIGKRKYRCKLSAVINNADCYIFVNRMGLKTSEKTKIELAKNIQMKQIVMLEQGLIIDRALDALTSKLRQKASA